MVEALPAGGITDRDLLVFGATVVVVFLLIALGAGIAWVVKRIVKKGRNRG